MHSLKSGGEHIKQKIKEKLTTQQTMQPVVWSFCLTPHEDITRNYCCFQ